MLRTRVITALVMVSVALTALFSFPAWGWGLFTLGLALAGCWEWSRLCAFSVAARRAYLLLSSTVAVLMFLLYWQQQMFGVTFNGVALAGWLLAVPFWLLLVPLWLAKVWRPATGWVSAAAGWLVVFPTCLALLQLRDVSPWLLLTFTAIVWVADVSAYFVGKSIGRHPLAAAISPGKTIEGAIGGLVGVFIYYLAWHAFTATLHGASYDGLAQLRAHGAMLLALFMLLGVLSVIGDLFESWMKRGAGVKDSSNLLPGHGGVLDRIDALTSTLPIAGLYVWLQR